MLFKYDPKCADAINQQSEYSMQMTKRSFGHEQVELDTTRFRQAIVMYLMSINGLRDDAFNYARINKVLKM